MTTPAGSDDLTSRMDAVGTAVQIGVAGIRGEIGQLKIEHPEADTSALEAAVAKLERDTAGLTDLTTRSPVVEPDPVPQAPEI